MADRAMAQETVFALREHIARIEGKGTPKFGTTDDRAGEISTALENRERLAFGIDPLDQALDGGLPLDGLTEIRSGAMKDASAASGFALAVAVLLQSRRDGMIEDRQSKGPLPILWISDRLAAIEVGMPYALGLLDFGIAPQTFLNARPRKLEDAMWLAEAAAASGAFAAIIFEISGNLRKFGLTESRRLSVRAKMAARPLMILRQAGEEEASSAAFRFKAETAPAVNRYLADGTMLGGSIGHSVFRLTLERSRNPAPFSLLLEWNSHDRRLLLCRPPATLSASARSPTYSGSDLSTTADRQGVAAKMGARLAFERAS